MLANAAEIKTYLGIIDTATAADDALIALLHGPAERAIKNECGCDLEFGTFTEYLPKGRSSNPVDMMADYFRDDTGSGYYSTANLRQRLVLKNAPVWLDGLEVYEDPGAMAGQHEGSFAAESLLTAGSDFFLETDGVDGANGAFSRSGVLRRDTYWTNAPFSVKVVYSGGWRDSQLASDGIAADLKMAAILTVAAEFWKRKALKSTGGVGGITSESIGKYSYSTGGSSSATSLISPLTMQVRDMLQPFSNRYARLTV